jgi:hypothetical protein
MVRFFGSLLATLPLLSAAAQPAEMSLDSTQTILAVVTHKGGIASGLAHDHLIAAGDPTAVLRLDPEDPGDLSAAQFELQAPVTKLRVDEDPLRAETFPRLKELGVLQEPFEELSDKDRGKIAKALQSKGQLDAKAHPAITARLLGVERKETKIGEEVFPWSARLALTVRGVTVEREVPARVTVEEGTVTIEALGEFRFTEFDIEPYSALLGAIKNLDEFHLYARLVAAFSYPT